MSSSERVAGLFIKDAAEAAMSRAPDRRDGPGGGDDIRDGSGNRVTTLARVYTVDRGVSRAQQSGKHDILMRVKTGDSRFVACPRCRLAADTLE